MGFHAQQDNSNYFLICLLILMPNIRPFGGRTNFSFFWSNQSQCEVFEGTSANVKVAEQL